MSNQYLTSYQPIPTVTMDNPAMTRSTTNSQSADEDYTGAGGLPSTYSSQQLMPPVSDSDSVDDPERQRQNSAVINCAPGARRCITRSQWFTVAVLCFVNLINYMDRFTIAGEMEIQ